MTTDEIRDNSPMEHTMHNSSLESDIAEGMFNYSALGYTIEAVNTGRDKFFELTFVSTSISELEGSEEGVLHVYSYMTREEAEEDVQLFEESDCHLDKI